MKKILLIAISAFAVPFISAEIQEETLSPACQEKLNQIKSDYKKHTKLIWAKSATINNRYLAEKLVLANLQQAQAIAEYRRMRALEKHGNYPWCKKPTVPPAPLHGKRSVEMWTKLEDLDVKLVD